MLFSYDIADVWNRYAIENENKVFIKLILKSELKETAIRYLDSKGINSSFVFCE